MSLAAGGSPQRPIGLRCLAKEGAELLAFPFGRLGALATPPPPLSAVFSAASRAVAERLRIARAGVWVLASRFHHARGGGGPGGPRLPGRAAPTHDRSSCGVFEHAGRASSAGRRDRVRDSEGARGVRCCLCGSIAHPPPALPSMCAEGPLRARPPRPAPLPEVQVVGSLCLVALAGDPGATRSALATKERSAGCTPNGRAAA